MGNIQVERLRDYSGPVTNTDIWDGFQMREDDVVVCTPPKCGTTWTLNIVMMLIHGRVVPDAGNRNDAPWLDCAFRDRPAMAAFLDGLKRRRCIKSHTPLDGINYAREVDYVVVFRHPVDVHFSMRTHSGNMKEDTLAHMFPEDVKAGFERFLTRPATSEGTDDMSVASIVQHYREAKAREPNGNVHFFHYADLTRDLPGQIARMADILNIPISPKLLADLAEANTFASMRRVIEESERRFDPASPFHDQAEFFSSGSSNKWEQHLDPAHMVAYAERLSQLLPEDQAAWLNWGDRGVPG